ncbi:hypothetical protein Y032_0181g866 [Ancylostoma ceylanicum]|uniref:Uncharacterized protein n=1 Tax=Ancylostoma ceylanicum TaxID=53326 RepID=A0A016ST77_9BILA|nr:hypothetical protein Y032_0181g866 [Ancylostoma ceylanicum]
MPLNNTAKNKPAPVFVKRGSSFTLRLSSKTTINEEPTISKIAATYSKLQTASRMRTNDAVHQRWTESVREHDQSIIDRGVQQTAKVPRRAAALVRTQLVVWSFLYVHRLDFYFD